jgi:hypothetical protein
MVSGLLLRLPILICLTTILCLQVPWAFCLESGAGDATARDAAARGSSPLVVSVKAACGHHHHVDPLPVDESHGDDDHEHLLLLAVGTVMPPAVSLQAPRLTDDTVICASLACDQLLRSGRNGTHAPGGAPPEVEPARSPRLLL